MMIVLNGPLGIGKSTTAWALHERFDRSVMLDMDYIAAIRPFNFYHPSDLTYSIETLAVLLRHHHAHGYRNFIVNWVFESEALLEQLYSYTVPLGLPVKVFRLTCTPDELEQRIRRRNLPNVEWEVERGKTLLEILERAAVDENLGECIDTTTLNPEEIVDQIMDSTYSDGRRRG